MCSAKFASSTTRSKFYSIALSTSATRSKSTSQVLLLYYSLLTATPNYIRTSSTTRSKTKKTTIFFQMGRASTSTILKDRSTSFDILEHVIHREELQPANSSNTSSTGKWQRNGCTKNSILRVKLVAGRTTNNGGIVRCPSYLADVSWSLLPTTGRF